MINYPKHILSLEDQYNSYVDGGLIISDKQVVMNALESIGYYRLRGYSFHLYNNSSKQYLAGTSFEQILNLYYFDKALSSLILSFTSQIEIALRVRFSEALLSTGDSTAYLDPTYFNDKPDFWRNLSTISSEITRSGDAFIHHNYKKHDGIIPIWAAVEIMSFGTLSKCIKNLIPSHHAYKKLAAYYKYLSAKRNVVTPSINNLSSWIHSVTVLRNACAHNARIYNRSFGTKPVILDADAPTSHPSYCGLYYLILAMKYLRPSNELWDDFAQNVSNLIDKYHVSTKELYFPSDWKNHLKV